MKVPLRFNVSSENPPPLMGIKLSALCLLTYMSSTLSCGPWTWPMTVPCLVFFTQPLSPRLLAWSSVYCRAGKKVNTTTFDCLFLYLTHTWGCRGLENVFDAKSHKVIKSVTYTVREKWRISVLSLILIFLESKNQTHHSEANTWKHNR